MNTPNPRGFAASSASVALETFGKPKGNASLPLLDIAALFDLPRASRFVPAKISSLRKDEIIFGTFAAEREDADLMLSFSPPRFRVRKDGVRKELKFKVQISTVTVTVQCKGGGVAAPFYFRASNRGHLILDSRDESRKLPCAVRPELIRLLGETAAETALGKLLTVALIEARTRKAKPLPANWTPIERAPEPVRSRRVRAPKIEVPPIDFSAMSQRQLARFNAKASAQSAADMRAMLNSNVDESAAPLPAPRARIFPAPFVEIELSE